jgi:hypothetical protein
MKFWNPKDFSSLFWSKNEHKVYVKFAFSHFSRIWHSSRKYEAKMLIGWVGDIFSSKISIWRTAECDTFDLDLNV